MIVAEGPNDYRLITQPDHADLAGQFAAHWGNDRFARLEPYLPVVLAAEAHDNGWWDWDIKPSVDDNGAPIPFTRTPRDRRSEFWGGGIDKIVNKNLYAGILACMHGTGLPQQRYGTMPSMTKRTDEYSLRFIQEKEAFQKELVARLQGESNEYGEWVSDDHIWHNWKIIQVMDRMSLYVCCNYNLGEAVVDPTPVRYGEPDTAVRLRAIGNASFVADPYPFDRTPLEVSVRGRLIPKVAYKTQEQFRETYAQSRRRLFEYTVKPA